MAQIDLRASLNAISDVVNNRPPPIRRFDQIYMKTADMLLHTEHVSHCFKDKNVVFVGDGDAIGLCLVHLHRLNLFPDGPKTVHILDFDERMIRSIQKFARKFKINDIVTAELYNVADPMPKKHMRKFSAFHVNPPFGKNNSGQSVEAFMSRGFEATCNGATGCVVIADHDKHGWSQRVLRNTEKKALEGGWVISELLPHFHGYHLDDVPDLKSCTLVLRRIEKVKNATSSSSLSKEMRRDFYGRKKPLTVRYVREHENADDMQHEIYFEEY